MILDKIIFDEKFLSPILDGSKVQTIRFGKRDYQLGNIVCEFTSGEIYNLEITKVIHKVFNTVTLDEVNKDGFVDIHSLYAALQKYYPIENDSLITVVEFKLIK
jgi:hypothetical protein